MPVQRRAGGAVQSGVYSGQTSRSVNSWCALAETPGARSPQSLACRCRFSPGDVHGSHLAPSRHQRAPEPEPYSPAEMRAVGIAASRSWDELPRDRGLLAPYSWRGATALRAQRAAGRIEWHAR